MVAAGIPVLLHSLGMLALRGDWSWLWLAAVTAAAGTWVIQVPLPRHEGHSITVAVAECFILVGLIGYGMETAVALASIVAVTGCWRARLKRVDRFLFNVAQFCLAAWLAGSLYHGLSLNLVAPGAFWSLQNLLSIIFCGLVFFLFNSGAVATGIALSRGESVITFWYQHFVCLSPHEALSFMSALAFALCLAPDRSLSVSIWLALGAALMLFSGVYTQRWMATRQ